MEYNSDFRYDLRTGEVGEKLLAGLLSFVTIEVKRDSWIPKIGNIAVEYYSRGKWSGICVTEADWWAFIVSGRIQDKMILLIETIRLKALCKKYFKMGSIKHMGDNNTSWSILIPWKELLC